MACTIVAAQLTDRTSNVHQMHLRVQEFQVVSRAYLQRLSLLMYDPEDAVYDWALHIELLCQGCRSTIATHSLACLST